MILMNVVQDETMDVPGFEHQTFKCSECEDVERRLVFTKQDRDGDAVDMPEQVASPVVPGSTVQDHDAATSPMEPGETVPLHPSQTVPVGLTQTALVDETTVPIEPSQTEPVEPTHPEPAATTLQTNTWAKAFGEKLRNLNVRAMGLRKSVGETERRADFNRVWDKLHSAPSSPASSKTLSDVKSDEQVRLPTEPIAPGATVLDEPITPGRKT